LRRHGEITVFSDHVANPAAVVGRLQPFDATCGPSEAQAAYRKIAAGTAGRIVLRPHEWWGGGMNGYLVSLVMGVAVGVAYGLIQVRFPPPPLIPLVGLFGMVQGEQAVDAPSARAGKQAATREGARLRKPDSLQPHC